MGSAAKSGRVSAGQRARPWAPGRAEETGGSLGAEKAGASALE
eukprot:CAMPEP_0172581008 /NCGR_PEP_ID=MMETSP1068-20121228/81_1 /TAXON_ID=35684 /ORGANISM="Pseudopedinella elastica, Strain CCMP716" /LENGTH=42 /DNA_ID= /DNA_START= /DNA_END= /DNA_ORIENTATION=